MGNTGPILGGNELAVNVFLRRTRASAAIGLWPGLVQQWWRDISRQGQGKELSAKTQFTGS